MARGYEKTIGVAALLSVGFFYGLSGMLAKYVTLFVSPLQASEVRFVVALLLTVLLLLLLRQGVSFQGLDRKVLLLYAFAFPACVIFFTLSIFHSSVALATAATYGASLISSFLFGRFFFQERVDFWKGFAFFLTVAALMVFTEPWQNFTLSLGLIFALLSGVLQGLSASMQKKLNQAGADHSSLLFLQCLAGATLAFFVVFLFGEDPVFIPEGNPLLILLYGASSVATIYLFLVGFKYIEVNTGSILVSSQLFFGPALAWLFLAETISFHVFLGAILVMLSGVLANLPRKERLEEPIKV
jgi:drug/metabolite transporter (DMT)-like permease